MANTAEQQSIINALHDLAIKGNVTAASLYLNANLATDECDEAEQEERLNEWLREHLPGHFNGRVRLTATEEELTEC